MKSLTKSNKQKLVAAGDAQVELFAARDRASLARITQPCFIGLADSVWRERVTALDSSFD